MEGLPKRLQDETLSFILVYPKKKNPIETGWQIENNYKYDDPKLINHINQGGNVGIVCGEQSCGLRILDDDSPNKGLLTLFSQNFGETFRVRDHLYFRFDNKHSSKIIFNHPILKFETGDGKKTNHIGECQGTSSFCVTNPSTHPSGEMYELKKDVSIITISWDKFVEIFGVFMKKDKPKIVRDHKPSEWTGDNITDIPLGNIISFDGLVNAGNECLQGSHPKHGSKNGMNFRVDTKSNTWTCFRCSNAWTRKEGDVSRGCGGPAELIAVMEGIVDCDSVGAQCFTVEQGQELINIAREKYGLTIPEQDLGTPSTLAKAVNITNLAKKKGLLNCPTCGNAFQFKNSHGLYYCDTCKKGGGLFKFCNLIERT